MNNDLKANLEALKSKQKGKFGFLGIQSLLNSATFQELQDFKQYKEIPITNSTQNKIESINSILDFYLSKKVEKEAKTKFINLIELLGSDLCESNTINCNINRFDFISKSDLMNVFADYCADQKINVFKPPKNNEYRLDLFLTKKDPTLKTESVYVLNGLNTKEIYQEIFLQVERSGEIADWKVFVTTPLGALQIGFDRLIDDMQRIDCWLYIIDPLQNKIFGVTKGSRSKRKDEEKQRAFISALPPEPIRAPSQVIAISKYHFSEKESYKSKRFQLFYIDSELPEKFNEYPRDAGKYNDAFQTILLISKSTGLTLYSKSQAKMQIDDQLIGGYLQALDSFVGEVSGEQSYLKEIDYQNFKINAAIGDKIKIIVITNESMEPAFRERIEYLLKQLEKEPKTNIDEFIKSGNQGIVDENLISTMIEEILLI